MHTLCCGDLLSASALRCSPGSETVLRRFLREPLNRLYTRPEEQLARQCRYKILPEVSLASPYPGILHHFSGPSISDLGQTYRYRSIAAAICKYFVKQKLAFTTTSDFRILWLAYTYTPSSVFHDMRKCTRSSTDLNWDTFKEDIQGFLCLRG